MTEAITLSPDFHSDLSPSGWKGWSRCPGRLRRTAGMVQPTEEVAAWGTMCHYVAEQVQKQKLPANTWLGRSFHVDGFDFVFDDEAVAISQGFVDYVNSWRNNNTALFIEHRLDCSPWMGFDQAGRPRGGKADAIIVDIAARVLHIFDLKTGRLGVYPDDGQLAIYALGGINDLVDPAGIEVDEIHLHIYQPRAHTTPPVHVMSLAELIEFGEEVRFAADLTADPAAPLIAGQDQCQYCAARGNCPAEAELALSTLPGVTPPSDVQPEQLTDAQLTKILAHAKFLTGFIEACQVEGARRATEGRLEGWKMVAGRAGKRYFTDPEAVSQYLNKTVRLRQDTYMTMSLMSPKGIEDLHKAGKLTARQWAKVEEYISQPNGNPSLVPATDKRPALTVVTTPDEAFADID